MAQNNAAEAGQIHGDREVNMANKKAAPVVTHGKRQVTEPTFILRLSAAFCKMLSVSLMALALTFPVGGLGSVLFAAMSVWLGVISE